MTPTPADRAARRAVLAGFAIQGFTFASLVTRLPEVKDDYGLRDYDVLLLLAAVAVASGVGSLLAGWHATRFGSAATTRLAVGLASATVVLPGLAGSVVSLVLLTCVYGLFLGAVDAAVNTQGVAVQDRYRRSIMTGFHAMWSGAAVVGAGVASLTAALDLKLVWALALVAVIGLIVNAATMGTLLVSEEPKTAAPSAGTPGVRIPWGSVLVLGIPVTAMWLIDSATSAWSGIYLTDGLDAAAGAAPAAYAAYQAVLLLVRLAGDRIVGQWGPQRVVRVSGVVSTIAVALIVAAPSIPVVLVGFALLGGGLAVIPPLSYVAAAHIDPAAAADVVARLNLANYLGYLLAAFTLAAVAETAGNRWMFVVPLVVVPLLPLLAGRFVPRAGRVDQPGATL